MLNKTKIPPHIRIALIHDTWTHMGGAERVFGCICNLFPQADVYIGILNSSFLNQSPLPNSSISSSIFSRWHISDSWLSWFKPFVWLYWKLLNLSSYDLVISSSGSFSAKSVNACCKSSHISCIYSPPKYLWGEENMHSWIKRYPWKIIFLPLLHILRKADVIDAQHPNMLVSISKYVQQRIQKYYHRKSVVIYPPVRFLPIKSVKKSEHFLFVSRLESQKGTELIIQTSNTLRLPLLVAGTGTQESYLKKIAGPTIKFLGQISDSKLNQLYASSKALLYCAKEEDFGLVPVEAMTQGLPVIAFAQGGVLETVKHKSTGILFSSYDEDGLTKAIQQFEKHTWNSTLIKKHAQQFSERNFQTKLLAIVTKMLQKRNDYNTV